jgi:predicted transcriptional regulator
LAETKNARKRAKYEIFSQILKLCEKGAAKAEIVSKTKLNHRTVNPYIDRLVNNKLVGVTQMSDTVYTTTERGHELLELFTKIDNALNSPTSK